MKKVIVFLTVIFLFTILVTGIQCQEIFQKVDGINKAKPVAEAVIEKIEEKSTGEEKKDKEQDRNVRIVLMNNNYTSIYHSEVKIKGKGLTVYYDKKYSSQKSLKNLKITSDSKYFKNSNVIKVSAKGQIAWQGHNVEHDSPQYWGMFYVYKTNSGLVVVNQVELEKYIAGVISSEIGEGSPLEALKAQAICARNFIMKSKCDEYKKYNAIANDSTDFQVYNRIKPGKKCEQAAQETKNIIMTYKGETIKAYYFSTSCGYTTDYKIWGKEKKKYLKGSNLTEKESVNYKDNSEFKKFITKTPKGVEKDYPFYRWNIYLTAEQIENSVNKITGVDVGSVYKIEVNRRGTGGIASQITVYGDKRQIVMNNQNEIRKALCSCYGKLNLSDGQVRKEIEMLPSAFIHIEKTEDKKNGVGFKIYGGGFGHGSGMSQNGAIELANKGYDYKKILKKFYHGIKFSSIS